MTGVLIRGGSLETEMHTERAPCEDEGRDWGDTAEVKIRSPATHQRVARRESCKILPHSPQKEPTCQHITL